MDISSIKWRRGLNFKWLLQRQEKKIPEICGQYCLAMKMMLLLPLPWRLNSNSSWHSTWKTPPQPIITIFISTIIQLSPPSRSTTHVDRVTQLNSKINTPMKEYTAGNHYTQSRPTLGYRLACMETWTMWVDVYAVIMIGGKAEGGKCQRNIEIWRNVTCLWLNHSN